MPQIARFEAFRVADGRPRRESILVRAADDDGAVGWGEAAVPPDCQECWDDVGERAEAAVVGRSWDSPEELSTDAEIGSRYAAAALDIACWDLWCRIRGVPLAHALGGDRTSVVAGARLSAERMLDTLLTQVNRHISAGYARITLKVQPGWDVEPVRAVRHAFPALALQVDAGGSYEETSEDLTALAALDEYRLVAIERPFAAGDFDAHTRLQDRVRAAVCPETGDLGMLDGAIEAGAGRALALRLGPFGGLSSARKAHDRATAAGWDIWCRGGAGYGVEQAATVALAGLSGCTLPSDLTAVRGRRGLVSPPVQAHDGVVAVPLTQSGLGHQVDEERLRAVATQVLRIPA